MKTHRKFVGLLLLISLALPLFVGCAGVATTPQENTWMVQRVIDYDAKMLNDDVMLFFLVDRPFRGSRWVME